MDKELHRASGRTGAEAVDEIYGGSPMTSAMRLEEMGRRFGFSVPVRMHEEPLTFYFRWSPEEVGREMGHGKALEYERDLRELAAKHAEEYRELLARHLGAENFRTPDQLFQMSDEAAERIHRELNPDAAPSNDN